ncbi:MAG: DUF6783 domain-containing protein [Lachnospiraceae bacterium]
MYVTICGRFCLNEGCVSRMRAKFCSKRGVQTAGMIFQTRFRVTGRNRPPENPHRYFHT